MSPSGASGEAAALCSAAAQAARWHRRAVAVRRSSGARGTRAACARRVGRRAGRSSAAGMRGQSVRRGGEELGVQRRAHARMHGSGGARGGAWGKGDGELSGARGVQHGRGRKEREGRKEGGEGKKKKRENRKKAKEKEKEKKRERKGEKVSAHRRNSLRPLRPGRPRAS